MGGTVTVELPDGTKKELPGGATGLTLARAIGTRLTRDAIAVRVNGHEADLSSILPDGCRASIITANTPEGRAILRHSTAHLMAQAVTRLWPGARFAIGPAIEDGFYYDFELPGGARFTEDDLPRIEKAMRELIAEDQPFSRQELSIEEGRNLFVGQPYKREIIEAVAKGAKELDATPAQGATATISVYRNSPSFVDLCRGPHVPSTGRLGHFALLRVAGAYWRGDDKRPQLQRVYGTAWESDKALKDYLRRLEEAERRDHRRLGQELDLFSFPAEIGSGLAVFHPRGGVIRKTMEDYSRQRHEEAGYEFVYSPHLSKADLFEISGHLDFFADGMYPPMELDEGHRYYVKPMNCPFHILIYRSRQRSYRELPLRYFEFGAVYRYEKSGVVHGLTRVRGMTMDDAHIFCSMDQLEEELESLLGFVLGVLEDFGLSDFYLELSTRPEGKAIGADEDWERATAALSRAAGLKELELVLDEGGGAFYGPKISVQARDAIGRSWQMSTLQLDFQEPARFGLDFVGTDNRRHRPVMIHRALFGSVERFMAVLLEHYAGALPTWLMPEQVRILPIADAHKGYALEVVGALREAGVRVGVEDADEPLGARIRKAKLEKLPYIVVVGDEDVRARTVGVNRRGAKDPERGVDLEGFIGSVVGDITDRRAT